MQLRLTKQFSFEMAHALTAYDGKCRNIHGHSYKLFVTIEGLPTTDAQSSTQGMVVDFSVIKRIVTECIVDKFDHAFVVAKEAPFASVPNGKTILVDFQPTTENLLLHFASLLEGKFPPQARLCSLKLFETDSSSAELIL